MAAKKKATGPTSQEELRSALGVVARRLLSNAQHSGNHLEWDVGMIIGCGHAMLRSDVHRSGKPKPKKVAVAETGLRDAAHRYLRATGDDYLLVERVARLRTIRDSLASWMRTLKSRNGKLHASAEQVRDRAEGLTLVLSHFGPLLLGALPPEWTTLVASLERAIAATVKRLSWDEDRLLRAVLVAYGVPRTRAETWTRKLGP